jgi:hypothetical protein
MKNRKITLLDLIRNNDGKLSGSGTTGFIMGIISCLSFIFVMIGWWFNKPLTLEISEKVLQLALLSTVLLGVRKFAGSIGNNKVIDKQDDEIKG